MLLARVEKQEVSVRESGEQGVRLRLPVLAASHVDGSGQEYRGPAGGRGRLDALLVRMHCDDRTSRPAFRRLPYTHSGEAGHYEHG